MEAIQPSLAEVAALVGNPARANMLTALLDGRALTATELAFAGGVAAQTASGHLARLNAGRPLTPHTTRPPCGGGGVGGGGRGRAGPGGGTLLVLSEDGGMVTPEGEAFLLE